MTNYLIRRIIQMIFVVFLAALFTYFLFTVTPGGPLAGIQQQQRRITRQDLARLRAQYEMDFYFPFRFSRWLTGLPDGPITIGGREILSNLAVGCYLPRDQQVVVQDGKTVVIPAGCDEYVYLSDIPRLHPAIRASKGILRGDFGQSTVIRAGRPVWDEMMSRLPATLELMIISTLLSFAIGIPIGIYSAIKQYSKFDYTFTTIAFIGSAMPTFFFGLLLILLFTVFPNMLQDQFPWLPKLPPGTREAVRPYMVASWLPMVAPGTPADRFLHLIMPVGVLTFFYMATWSRFVRTSMLEVMRQDYVRTARAKGLVEKTVIVKHALRNALIPFVTVAVLTIPGFFAGAIITETVFAWPGMGRLYYEALNRSDWNIALAFIFITAVLTVIATLLGDILYTVVDPRIKYT